MSEAKKQETKEPETKKQEKWETVTVTIPLTSEKTDDVYVSLGGVGEYQIKRGIPVQVPKPIADIINQSIEMETDILRRRIKMQEQLQEHKTELS